MLPDPVQMSIARGVASAIPFLGKKILTRVHLNTIADQAQSALTGDDIRFLATLTPAQARGLSALLDSPSFEYLALQAVVYNVGDMSDRASADLRHQVRTSIRAAVDFGDAALYQCVDLILNLLNQSVRNLKPAMAIGAANQVRVAAISGQVAAAAARNGDVSKQIKSLGEVDRFARDLRRQVDAMHAKIHVSHSGESLSATYADLYVTPNIRPSFSDDLTDLNIVVAQNRRAVILGHPGAGKSTLASKLVRDLANDRVGRLRNQAPLLLVVRNHTSKIRNEHNTLQYYLEAGCRNPYNLVPPPGTLEYLLLNDAAMVIIDGVDELGDSRYRLAFAKLVESFAHQYPLARIIVTSRIIGYREAPLDEDLFPVVRLEPFNEAQVSDYAQRWFSLDTSIRDDERRQWRDSFVLQSAEAKDLRSNPLVLSLLCALFRTRQSLPRNKPEIYEECAKLLFDMWDRQRGIHNPYHFIAHILPAVQKIAWLLFTDASGRQAIPKPELLRFLTSYMLERRFTDADEAAEAADDFLAFCAGRAWVLTEVGADAINPQYGFVHRTFLEYFTASQLVKQGPDPASVWRLARDRIAASEWAVVLQLAVQILERSHEDGADGLLCLALTAADSSDDRETGALLLFGARSLHNVAPLNTTLTDLVTRACEQAATVAAADRRAIGARDEASFDRDAALTELLTIYNGDTADRVAKVIAQALHDQANGLPGDRSASLIYAVLAESLVTVPLGFAVRWEMSKLDPARHAARWHRLLTAPTPDDIAERGLSFLYESTLVCGIRIPSFVDIALSTKFNDGDADDAEQMRELMTSAYPAIMANMPPALAPLGSDPLARIDPTTATHIARLKPANVDALAPEARASLLLLLLPLIPHAVDLRGSITDPRVAALVDRIIYTRGPAPTDDLSETIERWGIPPEAHLLLLGTASRRQ